VIASIQAGAATDAAGNNNVASTSTSNTVTYDATAPSVTIGKASGQVDPTNTSPLNFTVVFSEPVSGFATGDVSLSGTAGATAAAVTGSGATYNVAVSGMGGSGPMTVGIPAGAATDAAGNSSTASPASATVTYDATAPTVTVNQASGQGDPTNTSPINFTVIFSEPVSGFATGDVSLSGTAGATTAAVTGSGSAYNVAVSGMTGPGMVRASMGAGAAQDGAGNSNAASSSTDNTVTYDATAPSVAIGKASGQADPFHRGVQSARHRLRHRRREPLRDGWRHHRRRYRFRQHLQRGGVRHGRLRRGGCEHPGRRRPRRRRQLEHGVPGERNGHL
jgi:hypothetical protein